MREVEYDKDTIRVLQVFVLHDKDIEADVDTLILCKRCFNLYKMGVHIYTDIYNSHYIFKEKP